MVKTIITALSVALLLLIGSILECFFIKDTFNEVKVEANSVYQKIIDEDATEEDVYNLQNTWLDKKRFLHAFIPHNEIKEIDLWVAETVKLVKDEKWTDALSKLEVVKELLEQIPRTFNVLFENIL